MTAGPTPLPPAVSQVMAEPILYHRAPAFIEVYARCLERLPKVFQTGNDVLAFASSGSGAMESAAANLVRAGTPALVASCGKFGERWQELCDAFGADTRHFDAGWGNRVEPADLERELAQNEGVAVVFTTLSETSTGVVNDIQALAEVAHAAGAMLAVDAVSGLGAIPVNQDGWDVDVVVAGSQKALMCPPGLAFASANERALAYAAQSPGRRPQLHWGTTSSLAPASAPRSACSKSPASRSARLRERPAASSRKGGDRRLGRRPPARALRRGRRRRVVERRPRAEDRRVRGHRDPVRHEA